MINRSMKPGRHGGTRKQEDCGFETSMGYMVYWSMKVKELRVLMSKGWMRKFLGEKGWTILFSPFK